MNRVAIKTALCSLGATVLIAVLNSPTRAFGDLNSGKEVFAKRCSGCHDLDLDKEGPRLRGVLGRKAGAVPDFQYSDQLRQSGIVWDEALLSKWLEDTQAVVRDNDMEFRVANPNERAAIIGYLKSSVAR